MTMGVWHSESTDGVTLEIEFNQDHRFAANDPAVVTGLDRHDLRSLVLHDAAIGVLDVNFAARKKTNVRVHAEVSSDDRFHVDRPAEPGRIDHALDARGSGACHLEADVANVAALGAPDDGDERICSGRLASRRRPASSNRTARSARGRLPGGLACRLLFGHVRYLEPERSRC